MTQKVYIRPRKLDKRVRIDTRVTTKGTSGGKKSGWTAGPYVWAGISNRAGSEKADTGVAGGLVSESNCTISIRYRAGITAENSRLVRGSTVYNIVHIDNVMDQDEYLVLSCQSGVNNG